MVGHEQFSAEGVKVHDTGEPATGCSPSETPSTKSSAVAVLAMQWITEPAQKNSVENLFAEIKPYVQLITSMGSA